MAREKASRVGGPGRKSSPGYKTKETKYARIVITPEQAGKDSARSVRKEVRYSKNPYGKPSRQEWMKVKYDTSIYSGHLNSKEKGTSSRKLNK